MASSSFVLEIGGTEVTGTLALGPENIARVRPGVVQGTFDAALLITANGVTTFEYFEEGRTQQFSLQTGDTVAVSIRGREGRFEGILETF